MRWGSEVRSGRHPDIEVGCRSGDEGPHVLHSLNTGKGYRSTDGLDPFQPGVGCHEFTHDRLARVKDTSGTLQ